MAEGVKRAEMRLRELLREKEMELAEKDAENQRFRELLRAKEREMAEKDAENQQRRAEWMGALGARERRLHEKTREWTVKAAALNQQSREAHRTIRHLQSRIIEQNSVIEALENPPIQEDGISSTVA